MPPGGIGQTGRVGGDEATVVEVGVQE